MLHELVRIAQPSQRDQVPHALCGNHANAGQGLYVFVFKNESDLDVVDYPRTADRRKVIIRARGVSIKPGKFEGGLSVRLREYNEHLHRRRSESDHEWVLAECFNAGHLLDLSGAVDAVGAPARIFEQYWIEAVERFLVTHELRARGQKERSEWRHVVPSRWTAALQVSLRDYMSNVADRIREMTRVGDFR